MISRLIEPSESTQRSGSGLLLMILERCFICWSWVVLPVEAFMMASGLARLAVRQSLKLSAAGHS